MGCGSAGFSKGFDNWVVRFYFCAIRIKDPLDSGGMLSQPGVDPS